MISKEFISGDSITLPFKYKEALTGYKIRCEVWDTESVSIKKANTESGGSDTQIKINTDNPKLMEVFIDAGETTSIVSPASIEIEIVNPAGKLYTVFQEGIAFRAERITWVLPS